jgi:putative copper export protein
MGIWIELGVFLLVFVFAIHQFYDLKKEKRKREAARKEAAEPPQ